MGHEASQARYLSRNLGDPNGLPVDEDDVVRWPNVRLVLADYDFGASTEVDSLDALNDPARLGELGIDFDPRCLFRGLVGGWHRLTRVRGQQCACAPLR